MLFLPLVRRFVTEFSGVAESVILGTGKRWLVRYWHVMACAVLARMRRCQIRILFANNLRGFYGGLEQVILNYARGLARRGHASFLAYALDARDATTFSEPFVDTLPCSEFGIVDAESTEGMPFSAILDRVRPDVVFFFKVAHLPDGIEHNTNVRKVRMVLDHDLWCPTGLGYFRRNRKNCRHPAGWRCYLDLAFLQRVDDSKLPVGVASIQRKVREMHRSHGFDAVLAVSRYVRDQLILNGFPPERTHVCHNVLEDSEVSPCPVPEDPNVLYVGSLIRHKGVDLLLQALRLVRCPFHLNIVGAGKSEAQLRTLCAKLGLQNRVSFLGWVDHDDIPEFYRSAKVVAIPSCWPEPCTLVGQEAMRHGRPVIAYDVGGNSDWLEHESTGILVPEQDVKGYAAALERLLSDTTFARKLGMHAAERVRERFSFERYLDRIEGYLSGAFDADNTS